MNRIGAFLAAVLFLSLTTTVAGINENAQAQAEPLTILPFKGVYTVGMTVTLFGDVTGSFAPNDSVTVKVTNPNGQTYQTGEAKLNDAGSYTLQFKLEGTQAAVIGMHSAEATYKSLRATTTFEVKQKPTITVTVDKNSYSIGDFVVISGKVEPRVLERIEIRIYGFNNTLWKFVPVEAQRIANDGTFSVEAGELIGKNVKPARYKLEASYAENLAKTTIEFDVKLSGKAVVGSPKPVDQSGKALNEIFTGQQVLFQSDVRNNLDERLQFAYIVFIKDVDGIPVSLSWIIGTLPAGEGLTAAQSWIPELSGTYTVEVFLWKSIAEPEILGPSKRIELNILA
jgi:flagellar hook assembly protein FlgD